MSHTEPMTCQFCGADSLSFTPFYAFSTNYFVVKCKNCQSAPRIETAASINRQSRTEAEEIVVLKARIEELEQRVYELDERVYELEQGNMFWSPISDIPSTGISECLLEFSRRGAAEMEPIRIRRATDLPDAWGVLEPGIDRATMFTFAFSTKEEAEAFCQRRADD